MIFCPSLENSLAITEIFCAKTVQLSCNHSQIADIIIAETGCKKIVISLDNTIRVNCLV